MTNVNLDLQKMGLTAMTEMEIQEVEGGAFWKDYLIGKVIDFATDILWKGYQEGKANNIGAGGSAGVPGGGGGLAF